MKSRHRDAHTTSCGDDIPLASATIDRIAQVLSTVIGLDAERVGTGTIVRAIRTATKTIAATEGAASLETLLAHPTFQQHLIEAVVVSESWFLREPRIFDHVVAVVRSRLRQQPRVRLLSAPCAAGEEAYSLALALLDAGVPAEQFEIIAVDISTAAITSGRRGVYRENAFRATDDDVQSRWFTATPTGWKVDNCIAQQVRFLELNLLDSHAASRLLNDAGGAFDLICCRNLMIYLTATARKQIDETLGRILAEDGEVIVGAAEAVIMPTSRWQPSGPLAFGRRTASAADSSAPKRGTPTRPPRSTTTRHPALPPAPSPDVRLRSVPPPPPAGAVPPKKPEPSPTSPVAVAEHLANSGDIEGAIASCQRSLEQDGPQPAVLFLAAMLEQSLGHCDEAERLLEKVVYLEPRHEAALLALALAAGRRGDTALERRYRRSAAAAATHSSGP